MADNTPNLNLIKPGFTDKASFRDFNGNWDIIDEKIGSLSDKDKERGYNINWNALLALSGDWTDAINNAFANHKHVYFPGTVYPFSGQLTASLFGATLEGNAQLYGGSTLQYTGTGTALKIMGTVNYGTLKNIHIKGIPTVSTDYYNTGTIGIDVTDGNTSLIAEKLWVQGFDTLIKSNYNSYYNKFKDCRFEKAQLCLGNFSNNNMEVKGCKFQNFHKAISANGTNGPLVIKKCSFEVFNGAIVSATGDETGLVTFEDNYVEIYDAENLPTNFPNMEATGALPGKFGGNTLFTGPFGNLIIRNNELQLGGVFRIATLSACDYLESIGNNIHLYTAGNNLDSMFGISGYLKSYYVNDRLGYTIGANGGYSRTYSPSPIPIQNPINQNYYYDCILGKEIISSARIHTPALLNGWTNGDVNWGTPRIIVTKDGLRLQGCVTGTGKTDIVIFNIPANVRPFVYGTSRAFAGFASFSAFGAGNQVQLRYLYSNGDFRLENAPADLTNIILDGIFIPFQI